MDETLQPEVAPSEWIHTAPIQDLLARGELSPEPAADAKGPTAPATEVASEDTSGLGVGRIGPLYMHATTHENARDILLKKNSVYYHSDMMRYGNEVQHSL